MNAVHALPRLLWRPAMLWLLFPLFWAVAWPFASLTSHGVPVARIWSAEPTGPVRSAVWQLSILVPAVFGLAVTFGRLELQHTPISWMLPGARRGLLTGSLLIALPLAALAGVLTARTMPGWTALAMFAVALFSFTSASTVVDVAIPRAFRWPALLPLALAILLPGAASRFVEQSPLISGLVAGGFAVMMLGYQSSKRVTRARHFTWSGAVPEPRAFYWTGRRTVEREWREDLATERLRSWLRAARYERASLPVSIPALYLPIVIMAVLFGYLMNAPHMLLILTGIAFGSSHLRLTTTLPYPLSRVRRGRLAIAGTAIEAAAFTVMLLVVVLLVLMLEIPVPDLFVDDSPRVGWAPVIAMAWAWAPVAQWSAARRPMDLNMSIRRWFIPYFVYVAAAILTSRALEGQGPLILLAATVAIAAAVQVVNWAAVRRYYTRADLVEVSPALLQG